MRLGLWAWGLVEVVGGGCRRRVTSTKKMVEAKSMTMTMRKKKGTNKAAADSLIDSTRMMEPGRMTDDG